MIYEKPLTVAENIIDRANSLGLSVTPMQLQKLLYFTNGWFVEIYEGRELF